MSSLSVVLMYLLSGAPEEARSSICIVSGGTHVVLEQRESDAIARQIGAFFASCSFDSSADPAVFSKRNLAADWEAAVKEPRLYATLASAVSVSRRDREVRLTEALIPLDVAAPYWFSRQGKAVLAWTKCTWLAMKPVLCHPSVLPHLSAVGREQCAMPE
jgi:hypothetical protein